MFQTVVYDEAFVALVYTEALMNRGIDKEALMMEAAPGVVVTRGSRGDVVLLYDRTRWLYQSGIEGAWFHSLGTAKSIGIISGLEIICGNSEIVNDITTALPYIKRLLDPEDKENRWHTKLVLISRYPDT